MKLNLTKKAKSALRREIQRAVEQQLPEDEHDYTSPWVYDTAIAVTLKAAEKAINEAIGSATSTSREPNK